MSSVGPTKDENVNFAGKTLGLQISNFLLIIGYCNTIFNKSLRWTFWIQSAKNGPIIVYYNIDVQIQWLLFGRSQAPRLPEGVPDHREHVHDHVGGADTAGLHVHVHVGRKSAFGQQNGARCVTDEQHQKDILVRVLRAARTAAGHRSPPLEADAVGAPHHRRPAILVVHGILKS